MKFDGPCPYLTCPKTGPHEHEECRTCGALRHGNLFCSECLAWMVPTKFSVIIHLLQRKN